MNTLKKTTEVPVKTRDLEKVISALLRSRNYGELELPKGARGWALPIPSMVDTVAELKTGTKWLAEAAFAGDEYSAESAIKHFDAEEVESEDWYRRGDGKWATLNEYAHMKSDLARDRSLHGLELSPLVPPRYEASGREITSDASGDSTFGLRLDLFHVASVAGRVIVTWNQERDFAMPPRLGRATQQVILVPAQIRPTPFDSPWRLGSAANFDGQSTDELAEDLGAQAASRIDLVLRRYRSRLIHRPENVLSEISARLAGASTRPEVQTRVEKEREHRLRSEGELDSGSRVLMTDAALAECVGQDLRDLEGLLFELKSRMSRITFSTKSVWKGLALRIEGADREIESLLGRTERAAAHYMAVQQARLLAALQDERTLEARRMAVVGASLVLILAAAALVGQVAAIPSTRAASDLIPGGNLIWRAVGISGAVILLGLLVSGLLVALSNRPPRSERHWVNVDSRKARWKSRALRTVEALLFAAALACFTSTALQPATRLFGVVVPAVIGLLALLALAALRVTVSEYFGPQRDADSDGDGLRLLELR